MFGIADRLRNAVLQIPRTAEACPPPSPADAVAASAAEFTHARRRACAFSGANHGLSSISRSISQLLRCVRRYISPGGHHWSPEDKGMSSLRLQRRVLCIYRQSRLDKFCGYSHTMSPFVASHFKGA